MPPKTRHDSGSSLADVVGPGEAMLVTELPTLRAVLRHGIYLQELKLLEEDTNHRNYPVKVLAGDIREEVVARWQRANVLFKAPMIHADSSIERKIEAAYTALGNLVRNRGNMKKQTDKDKFLMKLDFLFDIASCTCAILSCSEADCEGCHEAAHQVKCSCSRERKIPSMEMRFMLAMRTHRPSGKKASMMMSGDDKKETKRQTAAENRKNKKDEVEKKREEKEKQKRRDLKERADANELLLLDSPDEEDHDKDDVWERDTTSVMEKNMLKMPNTALAAIRTEATNRQAACIATGFMHDLIEGGVLPEGSEHLAVDQKKIHRAREAIMTAVREKEEREIHEDNIKTILADSRQTKTLVNKYNEETGKFYRKVEKQDMYSMTDGDGRFLHHFSKDPLPEGSTMTPSESVALMIYEWCVKYGVEETLMCIAGDSTNSNTGWKGGVFHFLEKFLDRRLFWLVCQLHTNELKLRRLITKVDGKTSSKDGWEGELGKKLGTVRSLDRVFSFPAIRPKVAMPDLPEEVVEDLSSDQHYGYRYGKRSYLRLSDHETMRP